MARLDGLSRSGDGRRTCGIARRRRRLPAFFAKLTGLIVVAAALAAGSMVSLAFGRRITHGMMGGALGALAALVIVYVRLFREGSTRVFSDELVCTVQEYSVCFSRHPWVAGMSWSDPIGLIFFPQRAFFMFNPRAYLRRCTARTSRSRFGFVLAAPNDR